MIAPNFETLVETELLAGDEDILVRRCVESATDARFLMVSPTSDHPSLAILRRLTHEYAIRADLDPAWAAKPMALTGERRKPMLLLMDPGGEPLERRLGTPMATAGFLDLALGIATALRQMHESGVIHKDVKPANILVDQDGARVWLTGFAHASSNPREHHASAAVDLIAGTFAYMAPEQTGRMNRSVDSRSDLYSLGVVYYQMLTGALPFTASEPLDWVYCHIARQPIAPLERQGTIPALLSAIIMKLLAKNAEERYQTAAGVEADLRRCHRCWQTEHSIAAFPLATDDLSARLMVPEKLYGREAESAFLLAAFGRVLQSGIPELVMVSGYSGVGKSALVHELMKEIVSQRTLFVSGKYDQYKRDIPFATLAQAFGNMVRQILTESEERIAEWRRVIGDAVGRNAQVLIDLIPEVEWVIGPQAPVIELGPTEARNRFQAVFRKFISVCGTAEHPLVLFLDDMQWIDPASIGLLEHLATQREVRYLLMIGAYRDNEVSPTHSLILALEGVRKTRTIVNDIVLAPLQPNEIRALVADAIHSEAARAQPLAEGIFQKTGGNPFFAIQFLTSLAEERRLVFDQGARCWIWDIERLGTFGYTDNVVDLMLAKLQRLPAATLETLKRFACLGHKAKLATLALICGKEEEEVAAALSDAVRAGFVSQSGGTYRFVHDRIHETSYSLIPADALAAMHLGMGRVLLSGLSAEESEERIFDIVDHFNRGAALITDAKERETLSELNFSAGKKAKGAIAYAAARIYLEQARALLADDAWSARNAGTYALCLELAECEFLLGNFPTADVLFEEVFQHALTVVDQARVLRLRMQSYQSISKFKDALAVCLEALQLLGMSFPDSDEEIQRAYELEQQAFTAQLGTRAIAELVDLPLATDPVAQAIMSLLADGGACAFNARPILTPLVYCRALNMALRFGNASASCMTYISYGSFSVARGEIPAAFAFAELGLRLNENFGDLKLRGTLLYVQGAHINLWKKPLATSMPILERGFLACQEVGNLVFASFNAALLVAITLESGERLAEVQRAARRYAAFAQEYRNEAIYQWMRLIEHMAANLMGTTNTPDSFDADGYSEEQCLAAITKGNHTTGIVHFHLMRQIACFLHGRHEEAFAAGNAGVSLLRGVRSMPLEATHHFFQSLCAAALYAQASPEQQRELKETLAQKIKMLEFWAENCPENYQNRLALVRAELARIEGRDIDAMRLYDEAIQSALENGFVQNEGMANELAGNFYRRRGFEKIARAYLREARYCYRRWGADALVARLDRDNPGLDAASRSNSEGLPGTKLEHLDLMTVLKVSQALSKDIVLDSLIETLLKISIEHAGADRGMLILAQGKEHRIAAEASTGPDQVTVTMRQAAVSAGELPESVLNYVIRTGEKVLIDDTRGAHRFSADTYLRARRPKSVLCLPLLKRPALVGVLYLENHLTPGAFSNDRTAVLELLASQAAISLENASLYANLQREQTAIRELNASLEQRVAERTDDLEAARDKADRASRSKSEFLANMSHEIRTPINAITGFTTLALRTGLDPKQSAYLDKIQTAAKGLLRIINDLLDFSKIEAGHLEMEYVPFRLAEVVESVVANVETLTAKKRLNFLVRVAPEVPPALTGDPLRLGQVLLNLCSNAVKFTEQGEVELCIALESHVAGRVRLLFSIRDTGIGLSQEQAAKLFHAFSQADTSITRRFGGTGLGLVISRSLVEMMHGRIWLESREGQGSTFFFVAELGAAQEHEVRSFPALRDENRPRARLAGARLLLVEDNPVNQQLAQELLEQEGAEVQVAGNGRLALDLLAARGMDYFDAALVDLQMPKMDGYEATRQIRQLPNGGDLPLIAMTAHAMQEERERCLAIGMQDHLAKPIDPELMVARLMQWIGPARLAAAALRGHRTDAAANTLPTADSGLPAMLPGIDLADGLLRCDGDAVLYRKLLSIFHQHYQDAAAELQQCCADGDIDTAFRAAHSIKGAAANLGMRELAAAAGALEHALEAGTAVPDNLLTQFAAALGIVNAGLKTQVLPARAVAAAAGDGVEIDLAVWQPLLLQLVACLENNDTRAEQIVADLQARVAGQEPGWLAEAAEAIEMLDYRAALLRLRREERFNLG